MSALDDQADRPCCCPQNDAEAYFTAADGSPILTAAGLWDEWKDRETGEEAEIMHDDRWRAQQVCCGNP